MSLISGFVILNCKKGDLILFYKNDHYINSAIFEGKEKNKQLALKLWGKADDNYTWELIMYFLPENVKSSNVEKDIMELTREKIIETQVTAFKNLLAGKTPTQESEIFQDAYHELNTYLMYFKHETLSERSFWEHVITSIYFVG